MVLFASLRTFALTNGSLCFQSLFLKKGAYTLHSLSHTNTCKMDGMGETEEERITVENHQGESVKKNLARG